MASLPVFRTVSRFVGIASARYSAAAAANPEVQKQIADIVKSNKVAVFMKGDRERPMCGFSKAVVQILQMHGVDSFKDVNVLDSEAMRQGVKDFTQWPTIPQVFVNGEFVGGCDILLQMHRSGELVEVLDKAGIKSTIPEPDASKEGKKSESDSAR